MKENLSEFVKELRIIQDKYNVNIYPVCICCGCSSLEIVVSDDHEELIIYEASGCGH